MSKENGTKLSISPAFIELQNSAARYLTSNLTPMTKLINTGVSSMWSDTFQKSLDNVKLAASDIITASLERSTTAVMTERNKKIMEGALNVLRPFPPNLTPISMLSESVTLHFQKTVERMTESIKQASTLNLAASLQEIARTIDFDTVVSDHVESLPDVEVPKEVVHERLEQAAEIEKEETGQLVPYNTLSMEYVLGIFLPSAEVMDFIVDHGITDPGTTVIIFLLVSIKAGLFKYFRENRTLKIEFIDDQENDKDE